MWKLLFVSEIATSISNKSAIGTNQSGQESKINVLVIFLSTTLVSNIDVNWNQCVNSLFVANIDTYDWYQEALYVNKMLPFWVLTELLTEMLPLAIRLVVLEKTLAITSRFLVD